MISHFRMPQQGKVGTENATPQPDLTKCPKCGGIADNGIDRCHPPQPYNCKKCSDQQGENLVDNVNHPKHYNDHPSGIECITITEHMGFNLGNAVKYVWRADLKNDAIEDLKKAAWYIDREIKRRSKT